MALRHWNFKFRSWTSNAKYKKSQKEKGHEHAYKGKACDSIAHRKNKKAQYLRKFPVSFKQWRAFDAELTHPCFVITIRILW